MKKGTPQTKSVSLSKNALYYAILSFIIFGAFFGLLAILESKKALDFADSNSDKGKAKKVLLLSIFGISAPAIGFIVSLFDNATSFVGVAYSYSSWLILLGSFIAKI